MLVRCRRRQPGNSHSFGHWRKFRQTKIQNFRVTPLGHKNIRRLDVAVNDPSRVRRVQRICNLVYPTQQFLQRNRPAGNQMLQRVPSMNSMAMNERPPSSPIS